MTKYLDIRDLTRIASRLLKCDEPPVRDWGMLESAALRPRTTVFGTEAYPALHDKVAALTHSIARNRALLDGNKRLAFMAGYMMYGVNGYELVPPGVDEGEAFIVGIARGDLEVPEIAATQSQWVRRQSV